MSPDEIRTRAQQAFSKRWGKPPACRLIPSYRRSLLSRICPRSDSLASSRKNLPAPLRSAGLSGSRFRLPHRLAFRSGASEARPAQALVSNSLPRFRPSRRPQNHLGTEPPPASGHSGPSLASDDENRCAAVDRTGKARKPLPHRHQLGQHAGSRLSRALLALGPPHARRFSPGPDPRPPPSRLVHRALSVHLLLSQHPPARRRRSAVRHRPACVRKSPTLAAGKTAAGKSFSNKPKPKSARMASTSSNPSTITSTPETSSNSRETWPRATPFPSRHPSTKPSKK